MEDMTMNVSVRPGMGYHLESLGECGPPVDNANIRYTWHLLQRIDTLVQEIESNYRFQNQIQCQYEPPHMQQLHVLRPIPRRPNIVPNHDLTYLSHQQPNPAQMYSNNFTIDPNVFPDSSRVTPHSEFWQNYTNEFTYDSDSLSENSISPSFPKIIKIEKPAMENFPVAHNFYQITQEKDVSNS